MIKKLEIKGLKSIDYMEMDCLPLNLLIGTNSSGKSTINQGILVLMQNMETACGLNGNLISLGTFDENRCLYSKDKIIDVRIVDAEDYDLYNSLYKSVEDGRIKLSRNVKDNNGDYVSEDEKKKQIYERYSYKKRKIQYLSCHRIGPQNLYKKNMSMDDVIDGEGQYAMSFLDAHGTDQVDGEICKNQMDYTLMGQVNWWLKYIVNAEIFTEEIQGADAVKASYRMNDVAQIRPVNIGSGISYIISILIMCLSAPRNSIIIIENPEIHLHPSAQAKLSEFFYFIANNERQLFIESHSDHIFNGFRVGIANKTMDENMINMQFVYLNNNNTSEVSKIKIGKYGKVENQRKDLFDQFDIDINKMIGL